MPLCGSATLRSHGALFADVSIAGGDKWREALRANFVTTNWLEPLQLKRGLERYNGA
jgi:hypothetical protein